jgi:hypothetical protein
MNDPNEPSQHSYKGAIFAIKQLREIGVRCLADEDNIGVMSELNLSKLI